MHDPTRQNRRSARSGQVASAPTGAWARRALDRAKAVRILYPGALAVLLASGAWAQPGAHIDLRTQSQPQIHITPQNSNPAPEAGPLRAPPIGPMGSAGPASGPDFARPPTPHYQHDLQRLHIAAQPKSGYGSTPAAAKAAWTLGLLDLHGGVGPIAPRQAAIWFERATRSNRDPLAWAGVAWCAIDGCERPPDPAAAQKAINRLKPVDRGLALYLQWLLNVTRKPLTLAEAAEQRAGQKPDQLPESKLLHQAAAAGDPTAQIELGIVAAARNDLGQARSYFKQAADKSPAARANLRLLAERESPPKPTQGGEADQLFAEAQRYLRGDGVPVNYTKALQLYQQAASKGSLPARRMLELILSRRLPNGAINVGWMAQLAQLDMRSGLPQFDPHRSSEMLRRDPTPLFTLIPAPWLQRVIAAKR